MFLPLLFQLELLLAPRPPTNPIHLQDLPAWSGDHLLDSTGVSGTTAITALAGDLKLLAG
jgi:hypothetical protein